MKLDYSLWNFLDSSNQTIDQNYLISLEQIYLKILQEHIQDKPYRFNQILHIREQSNHLSELLVRENLFFLPYLLIPH